jgi:16S rRNA processing protein RimM
MARAAASSAPPDLVELGAVRGAYGLGGWVRIAPLADGDVLLQSKRWWLLDTGAERLVEVVQAKRHAGNIVAKWEGCEGKDSADACKGMRVGVSRAEFKPLAPDEYYWHDLLGVQVVNRTGEELGKVVALGEHGQGQWLEVAVGDKRRMIPLVAQYVEAVDLDAGRIRVDWAEDW